MGKFSRDKGARAERDIKKLLGVDAKRTGYAGVSNPDVTTPFAVYSVKDTHTPISLTKALVELIDLEGKEPSKHHFVAVKMAHKFLIIERIEQHIEDHVGG